jgi:RNA polymerase-binding transcription factor
MPASSTAAPRSPAPLPRLRSRGGSGAGSSDQPPANLTVPAGTPGRRHPRAASRSGDIDVAEFLAVARSTLTAQRTFRVHQLQQLDGAQPDPVTDAARAEIHRALQEAARSVLRDIDSALGRLQQGTYTRCPHCGETISVHRLRALPMTLLCGRCQRATAGRTGAEPADLRRRPHPVETVPRPEPLFHRSRVIRPFRPALDTARAGR